MKADQFQSFLRQNRAALAQVFSAEEMTSLKAVADDLQRSARSLNAVRIPGQSNTAQDMTALGKSDHSGLGIVTQVLLAGGASAFGGPMGAMASVMTTSAINAMRRRGMTKADDLVREALLDPVLAKGLLQKAINGRPNSIVTRRLMAGGRAGGAQAGASHDAQSGSGTSAQAARSSVGEKPDVILSASGKPMPDRWAAQSRLRALGHDLADFDIRRTEGGFEAVRKGAKTARPIYDDMRTRLADAGMPEKELDANATIMVAYYKTRAGRLGVDAEQLYRESRPDVRAGESASDAGEQLHQSAYDKGGRSLPASLNKDAVLQPLDVSTPAPIATHDEARASVPLGKVTNASGTNVEITKSTVKKWYSKGANETKRALAPHLVKAFENSVTYHEGSDGFSYAVGLMRLDGKDVGVRFVINGVDRHDKRLYQIEGIEMAPIYEPASMKEAGHRLARGPARKLNVSDAVDAFNKIQPGEFPLFQDGKRGAVTLGGERAVIELFKARDASTFMHEAGHVFLNDLVQDAAKAPAIKADLDAVSKWFGVDDPSKISRQNHEQFAQGFEQYLRDGKAPNEGMKHAFDQFRDWLTNIYRSLTDLGQPIPANIRDVYDRMLSSEGTVLSATGKPFPDAGAAKRRLRATGKNPDQFEIRETENGFIAIPAQAVVRQVLSSTQEDDVSKKKQGGAILSASGKPMPSKGAALVRLRALKLNPKDYEIRPVEGGFQAVPVR
ncbi:hypothetical protein [Castellaniella sp.]|uniref:hypothetical protein n=1 Tax=Castellaniella sp. TaxID=1955812 RepID=UPI002AFE0264|nr:hypothetical protein [Castellaniella sp.]